MNQVKKNWIAAIAFGIFSLFVVMFFQQLVQYNIFQDRDLARAKNMLNFVFTWHGPEMIGGSYLPGPASYFLHLIPWIFFKDWQSVFYWMILLSSIATIYFWQFVARLTTQLHAVAFGFFYLGSPMGPFFALYNLHPVYLLFFTPLILILLYSLFQNNSPKTGFILGILIGLSWQVHATSQVWIFICLGLFVFKLSKREPYAKSAATAALGGLLLSLTPFLLWILFGQGELLTSRLDINGIEIALKLIIYHIFFDVGMEYRLLKFGSENLFLIIAFAVGLLSMAIHFYKVGINWRLLLGNTLVILYLIFSINATGGKNYEIRYVIIPSLIFLVSTLHLYFQLSQSNLVLKRVLTIILLGLSFCQFFYLLGTKYERLGFDSYKIGKHEGQYALYNMRTIEKIISEVTTLGFTYSDLQKNTLIVGIGNLNYGFRVPFERYQERNQLGTKQSKPNGLVLIHQDSTCLLGLSEPISLERIGNCLPKHLQLLIKTGELTLGPVREIDGYLLLKYFLKNQSFDSTGFQNFGLAYEDLMSVGEEYSNASFKNDVARITENTFVFRWNNCTPRYTFCNVYVEVQFRDHSVLNSKEVVFRILGSSISLRNFDYRPQYFESYSDIGFEMKCGAKREIVKLLDNVSEILIPKVEAGTNRIYIEQLDNLLFAPFKVTHSTNCAVHRLEEMAVTYASGTGIRFGFDLTNPIAIFHSVNLPSKRVIWNDRM